MNKRLNQIPFFQSEKLFNCFRHSPFLCLCPLIIAGSRVSARLVCQFIGCPRRQFNSTRNPTITRTFYKKFIYTSYINKEIFLKICNLTRITTRITNHSAVSNLIVKEVVSVTVKPVFDLRIS